VRIAVLGAGAWGTALAIAFSGKHQVSLWARDAALVAELEHERCNRRYLPGITLSPAVRPTASLEAAQDGADLLLIATSTGGLGDCLARVHAPTAAIVWVCKGFDRLTGNLPHETVNGLRPELSRFGALSGPSFAMEVALGLPCALTLAANDFAFAQALAAQINGPALRIYSSDDLVGVELGGALKNVMAIAAGICDGLQLGMNARAALITRGSLNGPPWVAMVASRRHSWPYRSWRSVLTATGELSRNRRVGVLLAQGAKLESILVQLGHVAEGVNSAQTALKRAHLLKVDMPITEAVNAVLFEGAEPRSTVQRLLSREARTESG
jgi:glycerol-3-phosphate dehydrogenase (NAD(P)+)